MFVVDDACNTILKAQLVLMLRLCLLWMMPVTQFSKPNSSYNAKIMFVVDDACNTILKAQFVLQC